MSPPDPARITVRAVMQFLSARAAGFLLAAGLAASCSKSPGPGSGPASGRPADAGPPRAVSVVAAARQPMERTVTATGSLLARDEATLSIKVAGRLILMNVDLGSVVKQGDLLAQVDPQDYELRLRQAQAGVAQARAALGLSLEGTNDVVETEQASLVRQARAVLEEATKNRERVTNLSRAGVAAASEVDTVNAAYLVALNRYEASLEEARTRQAALTQRRAELDLALKQLSDTRLRAPFDGAIQARIAHLGEFLPAGGQVLTIVRTDPLRLRLEIPERHAVAVRADQPLRLRVEGHTNAVPGRLARVSPAISGQNRMSIVEADIPSDGLLRPGLFVRAEIVTHENDPGLAVPPSALIVFAGLEKVVTVRDGKALERPVVTGRRSADWVEVLSGLQAGERVVVNPGNLRTGQPVTLREPDAPSTSSAAGRATSGPASSPHAEAR